mgnify:CR=1 FL=1
MPQIKVIIVTSLVECSFIDRARKAGVESFWYKDAGKEELLEVMDRTMKGENVYPDAPPVVMIGTAKSCDFTPGELAVLRLVVEGESYEKNCRELVYITGNCKMAYRKICCRKRILIPKRNWR